MFKGVKNGWSIRWITNIFGNVKDGRKFTDEYISGRRTGKLPSEVNVRYDQKMDQVLIETSRGRAIRPLIVCKRWKNQY